MIIGTGTADSYDIVKCVKCAANIAKQGFVYQ